MQLSQLIIGVVIGVVIGLIVVWVLSRRHRKEVKKLVESRRKIERQRTQAVNDLFALRAEIEDGAYQVAPESPVAPTGGPDPALVAEVASLRSLIARADGALTSARRKRDENEAEIARLRAMLESNSGENVINLRPQDRAGGRSNLAL